MWHKYCYLLIIALFFLSCDNSPAINKPDFYIMSINFIHVSNKEYLNYVVAEKAPVVFDTLQGKNGRITIETTKEGYKIRDDGWVCQELYLGNSPYIHLTDDYYIIDWKWGNFIYEPYNVLLDLKWSEIKDRQEIWDLDYPKVSLNCKIIWGSVSRESIDNYLKIQPAQVDSFWNVSTDHLRPAFDKYKFLSEIPDNQTLENYKKEIAKQDSLQQVYAERLSQIISENALEKIAYLFHANK